MIPQKSDNPYIPMTPEEKAEQVKLVEQVGITSVHLHAPPDLRQNHSTAPAAPDPKCVRSAN
jgi:uncharacterized protein (DUF849 family)